MLLTTLDTFMKLEIYDYAVKTPKNMKAIAYDSKTRYVGAKLYNDGVEYAIPDTATVSLCVVRPDNVGTIVEGSVAEFARDESEDDVTINGVYAELTQAALCVSGKVRAQFKIEGLVDEQILRTEIFIVNNGEALEASTDDWTGEYQGVPLDELIVRLDRVNACLAPAYDSTSTYAIGDMVTYESFLYKCNTTISTPEEWTTAHWTLTDVMTEAASVATTYNQAIDILNAT